MSFFRKLNQSVISLSTLLLKLKNLPGLVYLKDQEYPVIAFEPVSYLIFQNNQFTQFQLNTQNYYESSVLNHLEQVSFPDFPDDLSINSSQFNGGYIGFISYDYAASRFIPDLAMRPQPSFYLGRYESFLRYENKNWYFYSHAQDAEQIFSKIEKLLKNKSVIEDLKLLEPLHPRWTKQQYMHAFQRVQEYIEAGDCYQINLTQEFHARCTGQLLSQSRLLWDLTEAPYAGYLNIHDFELLSCSPELFIEFNNDRQLKTRPIKGTMPRYKNQVQDQQSRQKLSSSIKDQAENVMIVDLLRNDLSVYAQTGTVKTTKLFEIESFKQVHHMVSEIVATLKSEINPFDVLMSALPGGSITGAPKIRAMQIIQELEGRPRGAYCGSMGYFNLDGTGRWNILIRSIQKYQNELSVWAGGGITIASEVEAEYQECFDKVSAMLDLLNTWQISDDSIKI